jgi:hypothetical protein
MVVVQPGSAGTSGGTGTGAGRQGTPPSSPTLQMGFKYVPLTSWFLAGNLIHYVRPDLQKTWNPDFTYAFGYDDWRPYTISAQYANYGGNRFWPDTHKGEERTNFMSGTFSTAFKFPMPARLNDIVLINPTDSVGCATGVNVTPRYSDNATNKIQEFKRTLALGCKYSFASNWYFNFGLTKFPVQSQKQPWDPDFTYGFGYFDWHPGTWSVQYNNYSGNRLPWNHPPAAGTGHFRNGSITISMSLNIL